MATYFLTQKVPPPAIIELRRTLPPCTFINRQLRCLSSSAASQIHLRRRPEYIPNRIPDPNYVRIFDTTLRDGEQSPGAAMTPLQKLEIARQQALLGVDVIEAGFPAASEADLEAVKAIAGEVGNAVAEDGYVPVICGLARCNRSDIDSAWEAVRLAKRPRIHAFISTSDIHLKGGDEVVEIARSMVSYARSLGCNDVQFSLEDACRSEREFLYQILGEVIKAGATTLSIPDTVGMALPFEIEKLIADIIENTPGIKNVIISTQCHNDLGFASANSVHSARAGARQLECTINGIGQRAGITSLEEVVMILKCRGQSFGDLYSGICTQHIVKASKMVCEYSGLPVQPHKAIVGANALKHESGMLEHKGIYETISPEDIGLVRADEAGLVPGKLSGRPDSPSSESATTSTIYIYCSYLVQNPRSTLPQHVLDKDIKALEADELYKPESIWSLGDLQVACGTVGLSTASVKLIDADGVEHISCAVGTGPVDSAYNAIDIVVKAPVTLLEYSLSSVTEGIDALATTKVLIRGDDDYTSTDTSNGEPVQRTFSGSGSEMDIVVSSVRAYLSALNKMLAFKMKPRSGVKAESSPVDVPA